MSVSDGLDRFVMADSQDLTPPMCDAIFAAMRNLDAYIHEVDDETPVLIHDGQKGVPAYEESIRSLEVVKSPAELCAALEKPFNRWRAAKAAEAAAR
jgi:hypothetical protein